VKPLSTLSKALQINQDASIYGSFAEIGAGQETANYFFKAGLASQTIAKSMSAYDMAFSDEIYGKQNRYVCKNRLITMLHHEYNLLERRLKNRSSKTKFFAFATTAATSAQKQNLKSLYTPHAWMGLRFQVQASKPFNDIILHIHCLDTARLKQHEALGILGVNFMYACFYHYANPEKFIASLQHNLHRSQIEINSLQCVGTSLKKCSDLLMNTMLLDHKLGQCAFFTPHLKSQFIGDTIFKKSIVYLYGNKKMIYKIQKNPKLQKISKKSLIICAVPKTEFSHSPAQFKIQAKHICKNTFYLLMTQELDIESLKKLSYAYTKKPVKFITSEMDLK